MTPSMDNNDNKPKGLNLDLKPEIAKGSYSNLAIITHSHSEFIIGRYEAQFGPIALGGAPEQKGTFNLADFQPNGTKS